MSSRTLAKFEKGVGSKPLNYLITALKIKNLQYITYVMRTLQIKQKSLNMFEPIFGNPPPTMLEFAQLLSTKFETIPLQITEIKLVLEKENSEHEILNLLTAEIGEIQK